MNTNTAKGRNFADGRAALRTRLMLGATSALFALPLIASPAHAQVIDSEQDDAAAPAQIVVTGSRIVRDGNDAPTPVSVVSGEEIATEAPANIADFVNTLPSVSGSQTAVSNSGALSNGASGISALNLRNLGQNRTLILVDGQRSVASTSTGLVDINTIPQALIERVEVVTGGASSVYGSDAVAGVVNFVLDKRFTGVEVNYEHGVTTYGDVPNHKLQMTAGTPFADDRGHIILSAEYFTQEGQHTIDRDWNETGFFQINNPAYTPTNGEPQRLNLPNVGSSNFSPGGLITSGPLRGYYFGNIDPSTGLATVNQLAYGTVAGQWMVGGDYDITSANHRGSNSLANDEERQSVFGRISYEIAPWLNVFGQASYSRFKGLSYYQATPSVGVPIRADNAYLPQQIKDLMAANGLTSITIGTSNDNILGPAGGDNVREVERYVAGADGEFDIGSMAWSWDGYYQHGKTTTNERLVNTWLNSRIAAMQDAIYDPSGSGEIVCRVNVDSDPSNDLPGCVPINRIGIDAVSGSARSFLFAIYPEREQYITQDVAGLNFSTDSLFDNWAGPVSLAFGGEYRKEKVDGYTDDIQFNPNNTWLYGNYRVTAGSYNVKEAYVETLFPLFEGMEFNGAFRVTDYSTSGTVTTWKAGLTWQPIDDIRLRATYSRDIRAPNLSELFDPGTARTNSVNIPLAGGGFRPEEFIQNFTGNVNLDPEKAKTLGVGLIFTPTFAPGFALSVDYFDIKVNDAIGSIGAQTTVDLCYDEGQTEFCNNIRYVAGSTTDVQFIDISYYNFASQKTNGIDAEASYRIPIGPGTLDLRALATYTIENVSDDGISAYTNDIAGTYFLPHLVYRLSASYSFDSGFTARFVGRGTSGGVYDNDYIECVTACPTFTDPAEAANFRTINDNHVDSAFYLDANFTYDIPIGDSTVQALFAVKNVFNTDPVLVGNGPDGNNTPAYPQTSRSQYDTLGRVFRMGLRFRY